MTTRTQREAQRLAKLPYRMRADLCAALFQSLHEYPMLRSGLVEEFGHAVGLSTTITYSEVVTPDCPCPEVAKVGELYGYETAVNRFGLILLGVALVLAIIVLGYRKYQATGSVW